MGLMRALWKITAIEWIVDNVKNIVDWFKKTIKEDCTEDNHIRKAYMIVESMMVKKLSMPSLSINIKKLISQDE